MSGVFCAHYEIASRFSSPIKITQLHCCCSEPAPQKKSSIQQNQKTFQRFQLQICPYLLVQPYSIECLTNMIIFLAHWLLNFTVHQKHLESLLKHRLLGTTQVFLIQQVSFSVVLMLQVRGPHFENLCFGVSLFNCQRDFYPNKYHSWIYLAGKISLIFKQHVILILITTVALDKLLNHSPKFFVCKMEITVLTSYGCERD